MVVAKFFNFLLGRRSIRFANFPRLMQPQMENSRAISSEHSRLGIRRHWAKQIRDFDVHISLPDHISLGHHNGVCLDLNLNGRVLSPRASDATNGESYGISSVKSSLLLGVWYKSLVEELKPQEFFFVSLARLIYANLENHEECN